MIFEGGSKNISSEQNPVNKKRKIIIANVDIEEQARDMAEEKMTVSKGELRGIKGFIKKLWKHNLAHEYYRQKEIAKAKREIQQSGNLYAGENGEKNDHNEAMKAIVERFAMEYETDSALRKGEEKKMLKEEDPEEKITKNIIKDLVKRYTVGNLTDEQFNLEKNKLFEKELTGIKDGKDKKLAQKGSLYADNLLEVAKQVKNDIAHGKGLDALDLDFDVIIGKAKAGVETQAQYNAVDKIVEKIKNIPGGRFVGHFVNEATVASAVAIAYSFGVKGTISATQRAAKWVGPLGLGLSAGIGGAVAGARENKRVKEERAQHIREMAKGKGIEAGSRRREEMERFRYETKNASDLTGDLEKSLKDLMDSPDKDKLEKVLANINEIDSRISFSEREKIDLISFSDSKKVEQERTRMYISTAEAKVFLKKNVGQDWASAYGNEASLKDYLSQMKEAKIQDDFKKEKTLKDEAFAKMKKRKVAGAVMRGVAIGVGVGLVAQEIQAYASGSQEGLLNSRGVHINDEVRHFTAAEYLRRYIAGDLPAVDAGHLPQTITSHIEGSEQTINVGAKDYVRSHEDLFSKIKRVNWAENDSLRPDKNELKMWWGGEKGTGLDDSGNYVFNVKNMVPEGSFHGNANWNPQELMQEGKMKVLISLSDDTQNQVVEIPIDADGNAIIDPNSEIGKIAFENVDGHAKFIGKFAEVAVMGENKGGADYVDILATHKGEGIENVVEAIKNKTKDIETVIPGKPSSDYDVDLPYVIPVAGRRPMEKLGKKAEAAAVSSSAVEQLPFQQPEKKEKKEWEQLDLFEDFLPLIAVAALAKEKEVKGKAQKEKLRGLLLALKNSKEQIQKSEEDAKNANKKDGPVRTAAWHTIYKLENSLDLKYEDLNAVDISEGDKKFLDLTRKLWTELIIHGTGKNGEIIKRADQDAYACLKLMELAGINVDMNKVSFVKQGDSAESGIIMDTSMRDGVIAEEDGKRLIIDHHGKESDRTTSAAKFVYETLLEIGLLKKEKYLDNFVKFVTKCDNFNLTPDEMKQAYTNYPKNLYGLYFRMKVEDVLELFKNGMDPMKNLPDDYLKNHAYINPQNNKEESLTQLTGHMEKQMNNGKAALEKLERAGFFVDTGADRFGKIFIDTKKKNEKTGNTYPNVDGENNSNQLEVFCKGYGGYLIWSPKENSFVLYTLKKMGRDMFSQGFNVRGNMWIKSPQDPEKLTIALDEIFSKLTGKNFKVEGRLREVLNADEGAKEVTDLVRENKLTEDILREIAKRLDIKLKDLLKAAMRNQGVIDKFYDKTEKMDRRDRDFNMKVERLAIDMLLNRQKTKNEAKNKAQSVAAPGSSGPKAPEKLSDATVEKQKNMAESVKKMSGLFASFELLSEIIEKEAGRLNVKPSDLAEQFIQSNSELRSKFEATVNMAPEKLKEKLAIKIILEDEKKRLKEKIKKDGESDNLRLLMREIEVDLFDIKMKTGQ
ncbi:MAG: hypothetical protein WC608_02130 [Parcubacteria group bacterium]